MTLIFLSSTYVDLEAYRAVARTTLRRLGCTDLAMEYMVAEDVRPVEKCLRDVRRSEVFILLVGWRYGFVPPNTDLSIVETEYKTAISEGKQCLVFLLAENAEWPAPFRDSDPTRIVNFRKRLEETHVVSFFSSTDSLGARIAEAIALWRERSASHERAEPSVVFEGITSSRAVAFSVFSGKQSILLINSIVTIPIRTSEARNLAQMSILRSQMERQRIPLALDVKLVRGALASQVVWPHYLAHQGQELLGPHRVVSIEPGGTASFLLSVKALEDYTAASQHWFLVFAKIQISTVDDVGKRCELVVPAILEIAGCRSIADDAVSVSIHSHSPSVIELLEVIDDLQKIRERSPSNAVSGEILDAFIAKLKDEEFSGVFASVLAQQLESQDPFDRKLKLIQALPKQPLADSSRMMWAAIGRSLALLSEDIHSIPAAHKRQVETVALSLLKADAPDLYRLRSCRVLAGLPACQDSEQVRSRGLDAWLSERPARTVRDSAALSTLIDLCAQILSTPPDSSYLSCVPLEIRTLSVHTQVPKPVGGGTRRLAHHAAQIEAIATIAELGTDEALRPLAALLFVVSRQDFSPRRWANYIVRREAFEIACIALEAAERVAGREFLRVPVRIGPKLHWRMADLFVSDAGCATVPYLMAICIAIGVAIYLAGVSVLLSVGGAFVVFCAVAYAFLRFWPIATGAWRRRRLSEALRTASDFVGNGRRTGDVPAHVEN